MDLTGFPVKPRTFLRGHFQTTQSTLCFAMFICGFSKNAGFTPKWEYSGMLALRLNEIIKNVAFLTRQLPEFEIPIGLPAAKELATVFWTLL